MYEIDLCSVLYNPHCMYISCYNYSFVDSGMSSILKSALSIIDITNIVLLFPLGGAAPQLI